MAQLDTRIPMQVPNVLAQQAQVTQNNRLAAQSLGEGFDAVQRGMAAPLRRDVLQAQGQGMNLENMAREQHLLGGVLQGLAKINGNAQGITPQAQSAWAQARGYLVQNGVFEDGELPDALDMETFKGLSAIATMPTQELTDWQRKMQYLTPEERRSAARINVGIDPRAQAESGYTLGPGQSRINPDGSVAASVPTAPQEIKPWEDENGNVWDLNTGQIVPGMKGQAPGLKPPSGYQLSPDGQSFTFIPGGPADPAVIAQNAQARGPSTVISMGNGVALPKPPAGYMWRMDQNTGQPVIGADGGGELIPIRGGPAEAEAQQAESQAEGRRETAMRAASVVTDSIARSVAIINEADLPTTGFWGEGLSRVPGTAAHDLDQMLNTVKANSAFDRLQQMRDNSATGGALGGVSTIELQLLSSSISALEQSQGKDQLLDNLARVNNMYLDIIFGAGEGPQRMPVSFQPGDIKRRYDFLKAQYPDDPNKVRKIMDAEGLLDRVNQ